MRATAQRQRAHAEPALSRLLNDLSTIPAEQVVIPTLDVPRALTIIAKSLPRVRELQPRIATELPAFDLTLLDKLPDYASALAQAHALLLTADKRRAAPTEGFKKAKALRALLLSDATALAAHGLLQNGLPQLASHASGYANIASDLEVLSATLRKAWPQIASKSPLTLAMLDNALELAAQLREPTASEQAQADRADASELRARAFTLTMRAYREVRRAVSYLREPEGDAEVFAPGLYPGRAR